VERSGRIAINSIPLKASSGRQILDLSALAAAAKASLSEPPASLIGKEITVTLGYSWESGRF
jgi:outer membrane biosynthesis protein TonB